MERICYSNKFDGPGICRAKCTDDHHIKESGLRGRNSMWSRKGIPAAIPAEMCYLGWQESLILLAKLVEVEIPD